MTSTAPREITREMLAKLFRCSVRTIDRHGIARPGNLLTRKEAALLLDMPLRTFDRKHADGELPPHKLIIDVPMWRRDELLTYKKSISPNATQLSLFDASKTTQAPGTR